MFQDTIAAGKVEVGMPVTPIGHLITWHPCTQVHLRQAQNVTETIARKQVLEKKKCFIIGEVVLNISRMANCYWAIWKLGFAVGDVESMWRALGISAL